MKFRTMQINSVRGLLTEYGEVMGKGRSALDKAIGGVLEKLAERLPAVLIETLALANNMARMIRAILAHDRKYEKGFVSAKPA